MNRRFVALLGVFLCLFAFAAMPSRAASSEAEVQTSWRLLDYIAVDYPEAVQDGRIVNPAEYREMAEFSASVTARLRALPPHAERARLIADSEGLQSAIAAKSAPDAIAKSAKAISRRLLGAYPVPLAPPAIPDLARGAKLYAENCASCHGGKGEGPSGSFAQLDPAPIAFTDKDRARERSLFGLYQVVSQGLEGTAMQSFGALPEADRWALAFHAGSLAWSEAERGEKLWKSNAALRQAVPDLAALAALTPAELEARIGRDDAAAVTAFLRTNPAAVTAERPASLNVARTKLRAALDAYSRGDRAAASDLALAAYLDGFEPFEAVLATRDGALMGRVEQAMSGFRTAIAGGESVPALRQRLADSEALLDQAEAALAPEAESDVSTFLGAFAILLREGLEALLVVIAMIGFLRRAERPEAIRFVHGGWVVALLAGAVTWFVATYAISISGQDREITEGFGSLLAAVILLSVGVWMHGKAQADEWRRYIATKMQGALSRGSAWFLFGLAFIVVYREVFETILFYAALWNEDNGTTIVAGGLSGVVVLAGIAWAMLRLSRTLPITQFFRFSAILIAVLAVVLAGKGIGALQEAGIIGVTPLHGVPRLTILGLFPTAEAIGAQVLMAAALLVGFRAASRPRPMPAPAE